MIDDNIIESSYGKLIKDGIVNSVITIEGHENITNIDNELATIRSEIYGQDIRSAIYSILVKVYNFAQPWYGTRAEYDSLELKDSNRLYIILKG